MAANATHPFAMAGLTLAVVAVAFLAAIGLAAFLIACLRLLRDDAEPGEPEEDDQDGDDGEDGEPPWWPEFERELAVWAADQRRTPRSPSS